MQRQSTASPEKAQSPAYRVEAPRASDAIALALRGAFVDDGGMPDDMAMLLRQLNQLDTSPKH